MTQIEDLLRAALNETPAPRPTTVDPMSDLERRIGRARMRIGTAAVAAVAVVVAAIVVPLSLVGGSHDRVVRPAVQPWAGRADFAVAGAGAVWTLAAHPAGSTTYAVEQRDPSTGSVEHRYPVRDVTAPDGMWFGLGQVWIANGGETTTTQTIKLVAVDAATGSVASSSLDLPGIVTSIAFSGDGHAWLASRGRVYELYRSRSRLGAPPILGSNDSGAVTLLPVPEPRPGALLATDGAQALPPISLENATQAPADYPSTWLPVASAGGADVWATDGLPGAGAGGRQLVREHVDATGSVSIQTRIQLLGDFEAMVAAPDGIYAWTRSGSQGRIAYYPSSELARSNPQPHALLDADPAHVVTDPAGGLVVVGADQRLERWVPPTGGRLAPPAPQRIRVGTVNAVVTGGGYVWTLRPAGHYRHHLAANGAADGLITKRDARTLAPIHTYRVAGPVDFMAYGAGRVWAWGGGDGAYPHAYLRVLRPSDGSVINQRIAGHRPLSDIKFQGGSGWLLEELPSAVVPASVHAGRLVLGTEVPAPDATTLAAGNGIVYALASSSTPSGTADTIATIDARTQRAVTVPHADGHVFAVLPDGFLAIRDRVLVREDADGNVVGTSLDARMRYVRVAQDNGLIYVALARPGCQATSCVNLVVYRPRDLAGGTASPSAATHLPRGGTPSSLAIDGTGAVDAVQGFDALYRWSPTGGGAS
ncbi:MAG: hypothetical protein JO214_19735 [Frankiaceae bacterium]|nr:hypothetical protein [Frankiaceae bacterium]